MSIHPDWYYSHFDAIFGRGSRYDSDVQAIGTFRKIRGARVLEIGCGTGEHAARVLASGPAVLDLVDIDEAVRPLILRRFQHEPNVALRIADGFALGDVDLPYDLVYCMYGVLQQVASTEALAQRLSAVRRILAPEGAFVCDFLDCETHVKLFNDVPPAYREVKGVGIVNVSSHRAGDSLRIEYRGSLYDRSISYDAALICLSFQEFCAQAAAGGLSLIGRRPMDADGRWTAIGFSTR